MMLVTVSLMAARTLPFASIVKATVILDVGKRDAISSPTKRLGDLDRKSTPKEYATPGTSNKFMMS